MAAGPCPFCRIVGVEDAADVLYRDAGVVAFRDIRPVAPIHILIIPVRHIAALNDLQETDAGLMDKMTAVARSLAAREGIDSRGYRLVLNTGVEAGQSVSHLHMHLLGGRHMDWPPG